MSENSDDSDSLRANMRMDIDAVQRHRQSSYLRSLSTGFHKSLSVHLIGPTKSVLLTLYELWFYNISSHLNREFLMYCRGYFSNTQGTIYIVTAWCILGLGS